MSHHLAILQTLDRHERLYGLPLSCFELGDQLNVDPRKLYASMSGMGRAGRRHWIEPVVYRWGRRTRFRITEAGRKEMRRQRFQRRHKRW